MDKKVRKLKRLFKSANSLFKKYKKFINNLIIKYKNLPKIIKVHHMDNEIFLMFTCPILIKMIFMTLILKPKILKKIMVKIQII